MPKKGVAAQAVEMTQLEPGLAANVRGVTPKPRRLHWKRRLLEIVTQCVAWPNMAQIRFNLNAYDLLVQRELPMGRFGRIRGGKWCCAWHQDLAALRKGRPWGPVLPRVRRDAATGI